MARIPKELMPSEEERHRLTLEALASVDAGEVVSHEEVSAWVDGLKDNPKLPPPRARGKGRTSP
jgi:predicted transcriptional regulator